MELLAEGNDGFFVGFLNLNHYGTVGNAISMIASELNENAERHLKINAIIKRLDPYVSMFTNNGAPIGNANALKNGFSTKKIKQIKKAVKMLLDETKLI